MIARRLSFLVGIALLALTAYAAWPQNKAPKETTSPAPQESGKARFFLIDADSATYSDATGLGEAKKVVATDPDEGTVVRCDLWKWNEKKKIAEASGNLLVNDPEVDVTGERADVYYARSKRLVVLTGNVRITIKPRKSEEETSPQRPNAPAPVAVRNGKASVAPTNPEDEAEESVAKAREHPALVTCDKVEYHYARNKKYAVLTGNFKVTQQLPDKTRTLTARHAEWFGLEDRLVLHGPVHGEDTKGMKFDTDESVTVFTKEGDERLDGKRLKITFPVEEEEEPAPPPGEKRPG